MGEYEPRGGRGPEILIEAGGTHQFDLNHLRRQGAGDLLRLLLAEAGLSARGPWRARVEKKITGGPATRPVSVLVARPWCVYMKIKPGDNDTAHFCSLLMPDGHNAFTVQPLLKAAEDRVNLAWRQQASNGKDPSMSANAHPAAADAPAAPRPDEADRDDADSPLLGWINDADRLRLTLLAIDEVNRDGLTKDLEGFVAALSDKLGWRGLRRKQIGGVFTAMVRRGLIAKRKLRDLPTSMPVAYELTPEGQALIADLLPGPAAPTPAPTAAPTPAPSPAPPAEPAPADAEQTMADLVAIALRLSGARQRLQEIAQRRAELAEELARLDAEATALARAVESTEVRSLVSRLVRVMGPAASR